MGDGRHRLLALAVLVPDRFTGGIIGAFLAAVAGGLAAGYLLPSPGVPVDNPPGLEEATWAAAGAVIGLVLLYGHGARREARTDDGPDRRAPARPLAGPEADSFGRADVSPPRRLVPRFAASSATKRIQRVTADRPRRRSRALSSR